MKHPHLAAIYLTKRLKITISKVKSQEKKKGTTKAKLQYVPKREVKSFFKWQYFDPKYHA